MHRRPVGRDVQALGPRLALLAIARRAPRPIGLTPARTPWLQPWRVLRQGRTATPSRTGPGRVFRRAPVLRLAEHLVPLARTRRPPRERRPRASRAARSHGGARAHAGAARSRAGLARLADVRPAAGRDHLDDLTAAVVAGLAAAAV